MVRVSSTGTTHLIDASALAVLDFAASRSQGVPRREIAHALGVDAGTDPEARYGLECIIDGLVQSGLLRQVDDNANPGPEPP